MRRPEAVLQVEQPQPWVTVDGVVVPGASFVEIESLAYFSADRFRVDFAIGAAGLTSTSYFAALQAQTIEIELALGAGGFRSMLVGQIDNVRIDLLKNIATLRGRDLSARLIDSEISETFVNQTSSQIARTIAMRQGLLPQVTATATPVGQYYELDHARYALGVNARATTEWNLLVWLAQMEAFSLSVTGTTLNFGPPTPAPPAFLRPADLLALTLDVATTIPTQAVVKSWNSRNKIVVSGTAGTASGMSTTLVRPNLTAAQADAMASAHLSTLGQHGTILTATMPGELTLTPNAGIVLGGTNSAFDQSYTIDAVSRSIDGRAGFTQVIRAHAAAN